MYSCRPTQDRIVVCLCCNQMADKERPLVVSRFPLSPAETLLLPDLEVQYAFHPTALMTSKNFCNWLLQVFFYIILVNYFFIEDSEIDLDSKLIENSGFLSQMEFYSLRFRENIAFYEAGGNRINE